MGDTYYSAELSHVVDKHFGIMKPIKYHEDKAMINFNGHYLTVDDYTLLIQLDKQRFEQGRRRFAVRFDMSKMEISDYDFMESEV